MKQTWKAVLGVILIFVFGVVCGTIGTSLAIRHRALDLIRGGPEAMIGLLEKRMAWNLALDAGQKQKIHDILADNLKQRRVLQKEIQPRVQTLNHDTLAQINAVLHPDQQEKFQRNLTWFRQHYGRSPLNPSTAPPSPAPAPEPPPASTDGTNAAPANPSPGQ